MNLLELMKMVEIGAIDDKSLEDLLSVQKTSIFTLLTVHPEIQYITVEYFYSIFHAASMFKYQRTRPKV
jgi:hypothetical protein